MVIAKKRINSIDFLDKIDSKKIYIGIRITEDEYKKLGIDEFDLYYGSYYLVVESTLEKQEFTIDNLDTKTIKLYKQIYEYEEIEEIVKNNEPSLALYGGVDGLDCYRKILANIKSYLNNKFLIAFEIGESQKEEIYDIVNKYLKDIEITCKKDLYGRNRMIFVRNKND